MVTIAGLVLQFREPLSKVFKNSLRNPEEELADLQNGIGNGAVAVIFVSGFVIGLPILVGLLMRLPDYLRYRRVYEKKLKEILADTTPLPTTERQT